MAAPDLFHSLSTNELKKEIGKIVSKDTRSLPDKAKVFSAIASIQKFDLLPDVTEFAKLSELVAAGHKELNRGITATRGVPAMFYVKELLLGPMYPGTLSSLGNGIYLASTQASEKKLPDTFPSISQIAIKYANGDEGGIVVRCALKPDAKVMEYDGLKDFCRDNRNRAREAGLGDMGAIAAALGYDAYFREQIERDINEIVWVVVNRNALTFQRQVLQYAPKAVYSGATK